MKKVREILLSLLILAGCVQIPQQAGQLGVLPEIFPDYVAVTIPCNIAPLNFRLLDEDGPSVASLESGGVRAVVKGPEFIIPVNDWKALTSTGEDISVRIYRKEASGWMAYEAFSIHVSQDKVDPWVAYRLIEPGYETWNKLGLYQRCLESFEEFPIMTNDKTGRNCMNCHSFCNRNPNEMMFHMRAKNGGTYTWKDGKIEKLNTKTPQTLSALVYPYWNPTGKYIAFSVNDIAQFFHSTDRNRIEVYDSVSDVVVYDVDQRQVSTSPLISDSNTLESFPCFSPDGRRLFFCSSPQQKVPFGYKDIRYSICSIDFDPETFTFGEKIDTIYSAKRSGRGSTLPRVSPDGKFLMFSQTDYGCFAIWHHDSDIRLISLEDGSMRMLDEANSDDSEGYHSWSGNSRWIIFASRRLDGLYSRLFIAHIDEEGNASKAFLVPQKDTHYYDALLKSYNVPEFIEGMVGFDQDEMAEIAKNDPGIDVSFKEQ